MNEELLSQDQRKDQVAYWFERADEAIKEAKYLRDGGYFNASVTRMYYACFYASRALLISKDINASTHNGVKTMISLEFVRKGLLDVEHGATLGDLFNQRHASDYEAYSFRDANSVEYLLPKTEAYIKAMKKLASVII